MKKIIIFIPAKNTSNSIINVLKRIPEEVNERITEVLVVDNNSEDDTVSRVLNYKKEKKLNKLNLISNKTNLGYGGSQKRAYKYAIDKGYDVVVMLHSDGQYAPEDLPNLIKLVENDEADLVFGSRMSGDPLGGGMSYFRYFGNKMLTFIENKTLGLNLSEFHSGYRVYNCKALNKIPFELCANDYHFDTEVLIQFRLKDFKINEKTISTHYGKDSQSPGLKALASYTFGILIAMKDYILHKKGYRSLPKYNIK